MILKLKCYISTHSIGFKLAERGIDKHVLMQVCLSFVVETARWEGEVNKQGGERGAIKSAPTTEPDSSFVTCTNRHS